MYVLFRNIESVLCTFFNFEDEEQGQ